MTKSLTIGAMSLVVLLFLLSCGGETPFAPSDSQERVNQDYDPDAVAIQLMPRSAGEDDRYFYDADISEVLQGPGMVGADGSPWQDDDGNYWAVVVSLAEPSIQPDTDRDITYRFIRYDSQSIPPTEIVSPLLDVDLDGGNFELPANVRFARVAACYLCYPEADDPLDAVEVAIAFQALRGNEWQVAIHQMWFDPADFLDIDSIEPFDEATQYINHSWAGDIDMLMMPDIAYDSRYNKGNIYVVFSKLQDNDAANIYGTLGWRQVDIPKALLWITPSRCQLLLPFHSGFHPRLDMGYCQFGGLPTAWMFGIAYTDAYYSNADQFNTRLSYGNVDNLPNFTDIQLGTGSDNGIPSIDIGPPGTPHGAIAWTASRSQSWDDVTVKVADSRGGFFTLNPVSGLEASSSPAVSVIEQQDSTWQTNVFYLKTVNPNSEAWNPATRLLTTDTGVPPTWEMGDELVLSTTVHGEFDTDSQWTNSYGVASGLAFVGRVGWMVWSSRTGDECGLQKVHGAYGFPE